MLGSLKPGERRILQALTTRNKLFKELRGECVKNPNILSSYLKNLQKQGLIIRDIDTREFKLMGDGWETLYLADVCDIITKYGFRKANAKLKGLDVIVSESTKILESVDNTLVDAYARGVYSAFSKINQFLFQVCKKEVLAFFSETDRQMIKEYEKAFHDAVLFTIPPQERASKESSRSMAEKKLKQRYSGIDIPEAIVECETETIFRKIMENETRAKILEIGSTKKLIGRLDSLSHLTDEEKARLKPLRDCLADAKKVNLHNRYMKSLRASPKTLVIFSSIAFDGYLKKKWQLFPDEEEAFKKKHPWLHNQIQTLAPK